MKESAVVHQNLLVNFDSKLNVPLVTIAVVTRSTMKFVKRTRPKWHNNNKTLTDEERGRLTDINFESFDIGHMGKFNQIILNYFD